MKIQDKIVLLRKRKGWSQEDLANELDVSRQSIYKWECGASIPDLEKIHKLVKIFDVSHDFLLNDAIGEEGLLPTASTTPKTPTYRKVFVSDNLYSGNEEDKEHGFFWKRQKTPKYHEKIHKMYEDQSTKVLAGCTKTYDLQVNTCCIFFDDQVNKVFGFYFNGAKRFVCPYENLIEVQIFDSRSSVTSQTIPVMGPGLVGVTKVPAVTPPAHSGINILYCDENGTPKNYTLPLNYFCQFPFIHPKYKEAPDVYFYNLAGRWTHDRLLQVSAYINVIRQEADLLRANPTPLPELDFEALKAGEKEGENLDASVRDTYYEPTRKANRIWWGWRLGLVGALFAFAAIIFSVLLAEM